ncbi:sarcoplasmic/endoplasmic reticulum calcium ATPase regulator ARLN isoform X2 [Callithrix jacchus]
MEMDAPGGDGRDGPRERRGQSEAGRQNLDVRPQSGANGLPKHSYWLDLWLFILFDAVVFLLVYFLPCLLNVNTARMRTFRMIHFHLLLSPERDIVELTENMAITTRTSHK